MSLHHIGLIAMNRADRKGTSARQLTGLRQSLIAGRGTRVEAMANLIGNTFKFLHNDF
jgi:hypothetical protein